MLNVILIIIPLYLTNQALISLHNCIVNEKTLYSILISAGLSPVTFVAIAFSEKKKHLVGIVKTQSANDNVKEAEA